MLKRLALFAVALLQVSSLAQAAGEDPQKIEQRRAIAESGLYLRPFQQPAAASGASLAQAMDIDPALVADSSTSGALASMGVFSSLGVIQPLRGSSFAVLSSGQAGTSQAEPGIDFSPGGTGGDTATLSLTLTVPPGAGRLSFSYRFLSAEFPEFINAGFDDNFTAVLEDANGDTVITTANVDSAPFYPASASKAAGSGFDLFTEDPSGVNNVFGATGSPDAGLTDFVLIDVPFESDGQIVLRFFISDAGDGILDSAVILDAVNVSSLEVVDAVPHFFRSGSFVSDPSALATQGVRRLGAAADGVTRLIVRSRVSGPGNVVFSLENGSSPQDGGFDQVGGSGRSSSVTAAAVPTSAGYVAFAVYRTPDELNRGGDGHARDRMVTFKAVYTPSAGGGATVSRFPLKLVRPPLVFVHGLWSNPDTWQFALARDDRFPVRELADYESFSASRFATNAGAPFKHIQIALEKLRQQEIAATQVDLIGHSMGGLLGRIWAASGGSSRDNNYNSGDIRKLFTLDTPHTGSPLANLLIAIRENFLFGSVATDLFRRFDKPIDEGAIDDLAKGSAAIGNIPAAQVPAHAFVGTGGSDSLTLAPGVLGDFYRIVTFFASTTGDDLFEGLQHDLIVGRASQAGGLPASATTVIGDLHGLHIGSPPLIPGNTGSSLYSNGLLGLLDTPVTASSFATLPAPSLLPVTASALALNEAMQARMRPFQSVAPGLAITSPAPGTVVSSGETVLVTVEPLPGASVARVLLTGPSVAQVDEAAPFQFTLEVPAEAVGDFTLTAAGSNDKGQLFTSGELQLLALPEAALTAIELLPRDPLLLGPGDTVRLSALGHFSDGIARDISDPAVGTLYSSIEPEFAEVSADGVVTAIQPGVTTLLARNGDVQDSVTVNILSGQGHYFTIAPCRLFDSRELNGPILASGIARFVGVAGKCGLPAVPIAALAVNVTVVSPNGPGHLVLQPAGVTVGASTINFRPGQTRANNALVGLSGSGQLEIVPFVAAQNGAVHVILDVSGYFTP